jgi:hypothetical protein
VVLVGGAVGLPLVAGTAVAQENTTEDSTTTQECELPEMDRARLYAPTKTINTDQAGTIEGAFELDPQVDCPVVVDVTMSVPSGMSISGGTDWQAAEAGIVATEFTMDPEGASLKGLSADVYSSNTGTRTVDAQIEYWPEGHPELSQSIDTTRLSFQVEEPNAPEGDAASSSDGSGSTLPNVDLPELTPIRMIFILALVAVVGIVWVFPKINLKN